LLVGLNSDFHIRISGLVDIDYQDMLTNFRPASSLCLYLSIITVNGQINL